MILNIFGESLVETMRNSAANVFPLRPRPKGNARHAQVPLNCWVLFYSQEVLDTILHWTNKNYDSYVSQISDLQSVRAK